MTSELIAISALAVSFASFVVNYRRSAAAERHSAAAERRGRMPVLVFTRTPSYDVAVDNVGRGPAMNIIYAQGRSISLSEGIHEAWFNPIHLAPIPPDGTVELGWETGDDFGLTYTDALGNVYTTKGSQYGTKFLEGRHLPDWDMREAPYLEELRAGVLPRAIMQEKG
jgi:hypothetical protein